MDQQLIDYDKKIGYLHKEWEKLRVLHNEEAGKPDDERNEKKFMEIKTDIKVLEARGIALKTAREKHLKKFPQQKMI